MFGINEFKSRLTGGGARPSLFQVQISNPIVSFADQDFSFLCYSAAIPEMMTAPFELYRFGRAVKYSGNRTYADWTVEIYNDESFLIRNAMESWQNAMNGAVSNARVYPRDYKAQAQVFQYAQDGKSVLKEYTFEGLFPTQVSPIQLSWEQDNIERFQVTFSYDLWRASGGITQGALSTS